MQRLEKSEIDLFNLSLNEVRFIEHEFRELSSKGKCEAIIFVSFFVYNRAEKDKLFLDKRIENDFLNSIVEYLYNNTYFRTKSSLRKFTNERFRFYMSEFEKLSNPIYLPMFIYNTFYIRPFTKKPTVLKSIDVLPHELLFFKKILLESAGHFDSFFDF